MSQNPFRYFKTSTEIIQLGVLMHLRIPLSLRNVEDLLHERGIDVCHKSVRLWVDRFGAYFADKIRKRRSEAMRRVNQWRWHLDEVFVKIRGETHYLWRAVDHEGEVLEACVTKKRDKAAALKFLRKSMKRYGNAQVVVTDKCPPYHAAMKVIGSEGRQETGRHLNNCVKIPTSHSADERGQCRASGECEVFRSSLQCIRLYTAISITRETSRGGPASNRYVTPPFANGANCSLSSTC
jgi:putative transposase